MKSKQSIIIIITFILFLCPMVIYIGKQKTFSESENRVLQTRPAINSEDYLNGNFQSDQDRYLSDQFPFRNALVTLKTKLDYWTGKRYFHDVYIGKKDQMFEDFTPFSNDQTAQLKERLQTFLDKYQDLNTSMLLVPNAISLQKDSLPSQAKPMDQTIVIQNFLEGLNVDYAPDLTELLKEHAKEYLYYRTDHHWTSLNAYYVWQAFASQHGFTLPEYTRYYISDDFIGTLASKSGYPVSQPDQIQIYVGEDQTNYTISYVEEKKKTISFYDESKLAAKDQYAVFMGGNFARVDIATDSDSEQRLLIFKDSYANAFVPFLAPYYEKIVMIDPRYYFGDVHQLIQDEGITDLLFLYNANTFFSDTSLNDYLAP